MLPHATLITVVDIMPIGIKLRREQDMASSTSASMMTRPVRHSNVSVVLADQHETARCGLRSILGNCTDLEIVAEADSFEGLCTILRQHHPDVVFFDLGHDEHEQFRFICELQQCCPSTKLIVFVATIDVPRINRLLQVGVRGIVLRRATTRQIVSAMYTVQGGGVVFPNHGPSCATENMYDAACGGLLGPDQLTQRDLDVLKHIVHGATNKEIAATLGITPKTVEARLAQICSKLGARSRTDAAVRAIYLGLVHRSWLHLGSV
jgi:DNA-binding NarL/FixJ family response regulator